MADLYDNMLTDNAHRHTGIVPLLLCNSSYICFVDHHMHLVHVSSTSCSHILRQRLSLVDNTCAYYQRFKHNLTYIYIQSLWHE